jgi:hypothetical protein
LKTALVTGASSGIGRELAKLFAHHGFHLILVARRTDKLRELADEIRADAQIIAADLAHPRAPANLVRELHDPLDVLVNNAGVGVWGEFARTELEAELNMIQLNVTSLVHLTKLVLPTMLERKAGRILNVSSTAAFQPGPLMAVYYATKAFVQSFSEALSEELRGTGVTVTALCPGVTDTNFQATADMKRQDLPAMSAERVAGIGYRALMKGQRVAIAGTMNRTLATAVKFLPRGFVTRMVKRFQSAPPSPEKNK